MQLFQILNESGELVGEPPKLDDSVLVDMLRLMLLGRRIDHKAISLQRRGKLGTYAPLSGQEAASVGSVFALDRETDWVVPQYREQLAMLHHGLALSTYLLQRMGHPQGSELPKDGTLYPQQVALGAHLPHAVGLAWGLKLRGDPGVVIAYFGDGASSEGDFHESCNLAGVQKAPVIFCCQNNGWAISVPWSQQSAAESVALRAPGYGMAGLAVDGNDALAMYAATADAKRRAQAGEGPTLIEAVCTRLGAHTTADDPTRYVPPDVAETAKKRDPIIRLRAYMIGKGIWSEELDQEAERWCDAEIDRAVEEFDATPKPDPASLFDNVYAAEDPRLRRQREEFIADRESR
ncbi:MAG TPA: pyruvate dehydrogenase (acetyl-transferring) E1 component subunit alpha [Egibacteraceae bacterium]|nr:pyruvate dehydrogenase (acetyl-transferring) E1 component subunit alpha [Egibacteraceae bacterium]